MARVEEVERRLLNWARWRAGGESGGMGYASTAWGQAGGGTSAYRESIIPTAAAEAIETDNAIKRLDQEHRRVVIEHYGQGCSVATVSITLKCSVATVYARIDRVHCLLNQVFYDLAERRRAERKRVEELQALASPGGFRD